MPNPSSGAGSVGEEDGGSADTRAVAFLPRGDRFEDHHDRLGISIDDLRDAYTGTWLFNYVEALQRAGLRPVLYLVSARVPGTIRFTHRPTGADVVVLAAPWLHRKLQGARDRFEIRSPIFRSVLSYVATPWITLVKELRRDRCEAILCQEYEYPRFDEAVLLGRVLRTPVFATYQGGSAPGSAVERLVRGIAVRRAGGLVIGAREEADRVRSAYRVPSARIADVPNAFDARRWRPGDRAAAREALGIPRDAQVVVWQGRVQVHSKGLDVLCQAWKLLCEGGSVARPLLLMVGSGQDDDALRRLMEPLPRDTIRWDDRYVLDRDLLWTYLSAADVGTTPSRNEGFPVAIIEAMACGLPVVAADASGSLDALGDDPAGAIVPRGDPRALSAALERLLGDEHLRLALGERARRRAEEEFSFEAVGGRLRTFMEGAGAFASEG